MRINKFLLRQEKGTVAFHGVWSWCGLLAHGNENCKLLNCQYIVFDNWVHDVSGVRQMVIVIGLDVKEVVASYPCIIIQYNNTMTPHNLCRSYEDTFWKWNWRKAVFLFPLKIHGGLLLRIGVRKDKAATR